MVIEAAIKKSLLVIPSINGDKLLARMLPTLRIPSELVVVLDQGSTDKTEEVCREAGVALRQLGRPHTYTEACNIGAEIAAERGCDFVFVANNDITFTTDVVRELLAELLRDPNLGIVAPAQMLINVAASVKKLAYRAYWDLETLTFAHDFAPPNGNSYRLEADFCELTFAGIRMSAIEKIGFLDNDYGFYHEDADFGFRLREAGYTCAYLPNSQIEHWTGSTFSSRPNLQKLNYLDKNKRLFAKKFLGTYVLHRDHKSNEANSWNIINKNLHPHLKKFGLVHPNAPELIFSHPGGRPFDYLYTVWETTQLPASWLAFKERYKMVLAPSRWVTDVLKQAGFKRVHYAPLGVDSDVFHPWGHSELMADGKTFLWFSTNQHRKGLDVMLKAWRPFHRACPNAKLILMGTGVREAMPAPDTMRISKHFRIAEYLPDGIAVYETLDYVDEQLLAAIYRSADFLICSSRSEGFGLSVAESMACGTPAIFGNFGGTADFAIPDALLLKGVEAPADYSDKGFHDVGSWWEPSAEHLTALLFEANDMDADRYRWLSESGVRSIRTKFSWRESSLAIRRALAAENEGRRRAPAAQAKALARASNVDEADKSESLSVVVLKHASKVGGAIRWRGILTRTIRRSAHLATFFADQLDQSGWKGAVNASFRQLIGPFLQTRTEWLREKILGPSHQRVRRMTFARTSEAQALHEGVLFIGYAEGALGLGQAFRANLRAAEAAKLPFAIYPFNVGIETRLMGPYMPDRYDVNRSYEINVIQVACDQLPKVFASLDPQLLSRSYNILCPYWELPKAPNAWRPYLANIHEIWAPNQFIADAFAHIFDGPIIVMPPAMEDTGRNLPGRAHFGMDEGRFYFMFSFDYYSSPFRKNPLGVVRAFQRAFPGGDENVGLVIKSSGATNHYPEIRTVMTDAMEQDRRILMFDDNMPRDEMLGLIRASDAYVSLHRAEGFGLGMAEAIMLGRIVIGTGYSGSADFLTADTGYPISYRLRSLEPHEYPWSEGQVWAEPDLESAITAMRNVVANPSEAKRKGEAGREYVTRTYSPPAVGHVMRERLNVLFAKDKSR
ncbi:glycosyltransferase [Methylovirgula sp. 4M-Z18]|uniref:glycosyltransferase n=1 Tax=Methylovirgula sp. 4M-Z18 TaxID=2293567 RepID=UPI000E2E6495|nr:glycosyltransferase [Methylovirgula sp. 4M-Z18]RFB79825.1 glycosyltransferase [Methylovirgula sp. 4M-Z18]